MWQDASQNVRDHSVILQRRVSLISGFIQTISIAIGALSVGPKGIFKQDVILNPSENDHYELLRRR